MNQESVLQSFFCDNELPTFAKIGIYGSSGTGKTRTAFEIIKGLYKEKGFTKPVVFFDTERGSDWIKPLFDKEGIPCFVKKSRTFNDLMQACKIAETEASFMIVDSISHVWRELTTSFLTQYNLDRKKMLIAKYSKAWVEKNFKNTNNLEFQHWGQIKPMWGVFTDFYLNSALHMIVCGRAGDMYEYEEKENGKKELIKTGSRMATEKELSYEPSLLIEMRRIQINSKDNLVAFVEKDRSDTINGKEFPYPTYEDFKPHFDFINIGAQYKAKDMYSNSSGSLFEGQTLDNETEFQAERKKRTILCEEIKGTLEAFMPGTTSEAKNKKNELFFNVFSTHSWAKLEHTNSETLQQGLESLKKVIHRLEQEDIENASI